MRVTFICCINSINISSVICVEALRDAVMYGLTVVVVYSASNVIVANSWHKNDGKFFPPTI